MRVPLAVVASTLAVASPTSAAIIYQLNAPPLGIGFTLTTDSFITSQTTFTLSELDSCIPLPPFNDPCLSVTFSPNASSLDQIGIIWSTSGGGTTQTSYSFIDGAFQTVGTTAGPGANLTVSLIDTPVPEPSAWAMFLLGFVGVGVAVRRAKLRKQLARTA